MKQSDLEKFLKRNQKFFEIEVIGKSVLGQNIYAVKKTCSERSDWVLVTSGMHAREHLSTDFVCWLLRKARRKNFDFNLCFVPLINPDGVDLCVNGTHGLDEKTRTKLVNINGSEDFSLFKANANGVDLNNNWDANWDTKISNKEKPSSQGFYGFSPMSEPEVISLANLTQKLLPKLAISFHLKGEEIYFDFFQDEKSFARDQKIAQIFAKSSGYAIKSTQKTSSGGFKDWCVQKLQIPALTIELGADKFSHPFPVSQLPQICRKNKKFFESVKQSLKICEEFDKERDF